MAKQNVTVRRAPRLWSFLISGALLGLVAALVLTIASPVDPAVGFWPMFGFFAVFGGAIGFVAGGLVGLILDATARRRSGVAEVTASKPRTRR